MLSSARNSARVSCAALPGFNMGPPVGALGNLQDICKTRGRATYGPPDRTRAFEQLASHVRATCRLLTGLSWAFESLTALRAT